MSWFGGGDSEAIPTIEAEQVSLEIESNEDGPVMDKKKKLGKLNKPPKDLKDGGAHKESSRHHEHEHYPEDEGGTIVKYGIVQKGWSFDLWTWKKAFIGGLPHDDFKVLHEKHVKIFWFFAFIAYCIQMGLLAYFFSIGITSGLTSKFVSLDINSGNCNSIGQTLDITQYASKKGAWQGFRSFKYQEAKYLFVFQGFDGLEFESYIEDIFTNVVKPLGEAAVNLPLYMNVITWITYTDYDFRRRGAEDVVTTFKFAGETTSIFDKVQRRARIARYDSNNVLVASCPPEDVTFNKDTKKFTLSWKMDMSNIDTSNMKFASNPTSVATSGGYYQYCFGGTNSGYDGALTSPQDYDYHSDYGETFSLAMDMESFMVAVALNTKVINATSLESSGLTHTVANEESFFDPRMDGMDSIYCTYDLVASAQIIYSDDAFNNLPPGTGGSYGGSYGGGFYGGGSYYGSYYGSYGGHPQARAEIRRNLQEMGMDVKDEEGDFDYDRRRLATSDDYCYVNVGGRLCLPVFIPQNPGCMSCQSGATEAQYNSGGCYDMSFVSACLFSAQGGLESDYKTAGSGSGKLFDIPSTFAETAIYMNIMEMTQNAFDDPQNLVTTLSSAWTDSTFCPGCMLMVIETADDEDKKINDFKHQLTPTNSSRPKSTTEADRISTNYGHCADSFSIPDFEWKRLKNVPPAPLIENIYECTEHIENVIINSFGIAAANSAAMSGYLCLFFIMFAYWFIDNAVPQIELPDDEEKVKILERLRLYPG